MQRWRYRNISQSGTRLDMPRGGILRVLRGSIDRLRASPADIVLGLASTRSRSHLQQLGQSVGGRSYHWWKADGYSSFDARGNRRDFILAFDQATTTALATGGRIRFDLTGFNLARALRIRGPLSRYDPPQRGAITEWELAQVRSDPRLFRITDFYVHVDGWYRKLTPAEVSDLGIRPFPR